MQWALKEAHLDPHSHRRAAGVLPDGNVTDGSYSCNTKCEAVRQTMRHKEEEGLYTLASQQGCVDVLGKSSLGKSTGLSVNHV